MDQSPPMPEHHGHCNNNGTDPSSAAPVAAKSSNLSRKSAASARQSNDVDCGSSSSSGDDSSGEAIDRTLSGPLKKRRTPTKGSFDPEDPKRRRIVIQRASFCNTATTTNSDVSESEHEPTTTRTTAHAGAAPVPAASVAGRNVEEARPVKFTRELRPAPYFYYIDRSCEQDYDALSPLSPPLCVPNFVIKLHAILIRKDLRSVITWMPHGRSWKIINLPEFEKKVLPQYFKQSNMKSFHRQANGWGFRRMLKGPDKGSFYNEFFLRGVPHLCKKMKRIGGAKTIEDANISHEPNLWMISTIHPLPETMRQDDLNFTVLKTINECIEKHGPKAQMPFVHELQSAGAKPASIHSAAAGGAHPVFSTRDAASMMKSPSSSSSATAKRTSSDLSFENTNSDKYSSSKPSPVNAEVHAECTGISSSGFSEAIRAKFAQNSEQCSKTEVSAHSNCMLAPNHQAPFSRQVNQPWSNINQFQQLQNYIQQLQQQQQQKQQQPPPSSSIEEVLGLLLRGSLPTTTAPTSAGVCFPQSNSFLDPYPQTSTLQHPHAPVPAAPKNTNTYRTAEIFHQALFQKNRTNINLERMLLSLLDRPTSNRNRETIQSSMIPSYQQLSNSTGYNQSNLITRSSNSQQPIIQSQNADTALKNQLEAALKAQLQSSCQTQGMSGTMQAEPHLAPAPQVHQQQPLQQSHYDNDTSSNNISQDTLNDMLSQSVVADILIGFGNSNSRNKEYRRQDQNQQGNSIDFKPHGNNEYG